jgi:DNA polymerase III gamma/tau subunit
MKELYKKYRPTHFKKMIGQNNAVKLLSQMVKNNKVPHTLLFTGPSGCGKTTLARILKKELNCGQPDFNEVNCADVRGIEEIRNIRRRMQTVPIAGDCRIWLIDEAHKLTNDAQNAFLKMLEDTPSHVYFMLATTNPQKLLRTIRNRSTEIAVKSLSDLDIALLLRRICKKEQVKIPVKVSKKIINHSEGSARKALVLLNQVVQLEKEKDMLTAIEKTTMEAQAIAIARALHNHRTRWPEMSKILKATLDEEPEQIRWMVLGYARTILLSGSKLSGRAYIVIDAFREHFYDSKHAGLVAACYEVIIGTK